MAFHFGRRGIFGHAGQDHIGEVQRLQRAPLLGVGAGAFDECGRFGTQPYSLAGAGVTRADLEPIFAEYISAFDIELEEV